MNMKNISLFAALLFSVVWCPAQNAPQTAGRQVRTQWFGQSFVTLVTSGGVRIAIDPFDNKTNRYPLPTNMPVDIVLVTNEDDDHNNTDFLGGNPIIFRSSTGEGTNRGNGIIFRGVAALKDENSRAMIGNKSMIYAFTLDGIRFCHLGAIGQKTLRERQLQQIGQVDVLFLPIGNSDHDEIVAQINPKVVVPIHYKTPLTVVPLYDVEAFIKNKQPVRRFETNEIHFSRDRLPEKTEIWVYANPPEKI